MPFLFVTKHKKGILRNFKKSLNYNLLLRKLFEKPPHLCLHTFFNSSRVVDQVSTSWELKTIPLTKSPKFHTKKLKFFQMSRCHFERRIPRVLSSFFFFLYFQSLLTWCSQIPRVNNSSLYLFRSRLSTCLEKFCSDFSRTLQPAFLRFIYDWNIQKVCICSVFFF